MSTAEEEAAAKAAAEAESKPVTMAELKALLADHNKSTNAAFAEHSKRLKKDLETRLAAIAPKPKPAEGEEGTEVEPVVEQPNKTGKPATAPTERKPPEQTTAAQPDPELAKLRKQLEQMQAKQKESEQRAAQAERKRLESEGFASLKSALSGKVAAGSEDIVLATLKGRNAVIIGDDGAVRLKLGAKDEPEEGLELADGVGHFLKSPEAKFFLPVPNAGPIVKKSNGQTPPANRSNGAAPVNAEEAFEKKTGKSLLDSL